MRFFRPLSLEDSWEPAGLARGGVTGLPSPAGGLASVTALKALGTSTTSDASTSAIVQQAGQAWGLQASATCVHANVQPAPGVSICTCNSGIDATPTSSCRRAGSHDQQATEHHALFTTLTTAVVLAAEHTLMGSGSWLSTYKAPSSISPLLPFHLPRTTTCPQAAHHATGRVMKNQSS